MDKILSLRVLRPLYTCSVHVRYCHGVDRSTGHADVRAVAGSTHQPAAGHSGRILRQRRNRKSGVIVMLSPTAQATRLNIARHKARYAVARVETEKRMAKVKTQRAILEKYCGTGTYSPIIPKPPTQRLLRRPRIERDLVGTFKPVRVRASSIGEAVDPYLEETKKVRLSSQLPLSYDDKMMAKADQVFYIPNYYDEKNLPPFMKIAPIEHVLHIRILAGLGGLICFLAVASVWLYADMFEDSTKEVRKAYRQILLRVFPLDFLDDVVIEEFRERERVAAEKFLTSNEHIVARLQEDVEKAQIVYQKTLKYTSPPSPTAPLLSIPR